jgi:hypothetical protein
MSTAWDGPDGQHGSIAKHVSSPGRGGEKIELLRSNLVARPRQEWKGYGKNGLSLEDAIEKSIAEAAR